MSGGLEPRDIGKDGQLVSSPVVGVMLPCDGCGDLLRLIIRYHGRALCRACVANEAKWGFR